MYRSPTTEVYEKQLMDLVACTLIHLIDYTSELSVINQEKGRLMLKFLLKSSNVFRHKVTWDKYELRKMLQLSV